MIDPLAQLQNELDQPGNLGIVLGRTSFHQEPYFMIVHRQKGSKSYLGHSLASLLAQAAEDIAPPPSTFTLADLGL